MNEQIPPDESKAAVGQSALNVELGMADRLRAWIPNGDGYNSEYAHTLAEAADEIDKLNAFIEKAFDVHPNLDIDIEQLDA